MDEMGQYKKENGKPPKLTCIFDHNMIINTPIGPKISPLRCPNILRDYFYRTDQTTEIRLSLGFYSSENKYTMVKEVWEEFKDNVNSADIRNHFKLWVSHILGTFIDPPGPETVCYSIMIPLQPIQAYLS